MKLDFGMTFNGNGCSYDNEENVENKVEFLTEKVIFKVIRSKICPNSSLEYFFRPKEWHFR